MIDCESVLGCPNGEELPCEETATQFFYFEDPVSVAAACDQHARLFNDGKPISKQEYEVFKLHEE